MAISKEDKHDVKTHLGKALLNKVAKKGGDVVRAIREPHHKFKMDRINKEYGFIKDYGAKKKSGVPISDKERAQYKGLEDRKF